MAKKKATKTKKVAKKKSSLADKLKAAKRDLEKARQNAARTGERLFGECVKKIFKDHPDLHTFSWPEYTPSWNDGDACTFGVHLDSLKINDEEDDAECIYTLEHLHKLLSNKKKSEARIVMELSDPKKEKWEVESLKRDLEIVRTRDADEVAAKYRIKKDIHELLSSIDESVYEDMFGEGLVVVTREGVTIENYEHD